MKLTEISRGALSHIEIDKPTLIKMGVDPIANAFVVSATVPLLMKQNLEMAHASSEAWHGHFKYLILAMPGLIAAAAKVCEIESSIDERIENKNIVDAIHGLADALVPYKNVI